MGALVRKLIQNIDEFAKRAEKAGYTKDAYWGESPNSRMRLYSDKFHDPEYNSFKSPVFIATQPGHAETYSSANGGFIMPLKVNDEGFGTVDYSGRTWRGEVLPGLADEFKVNKRPPHMILRDAQGNKLQNITGASTEDLRWLTEKYDLPGVEIRNVWDLGREKPYTEFGIPSQYPTAPQLEYYIRDTSRLRLPWAKFEDLASKSLTAGGAPVGVGGIFGALGNADDTMGNNDRSRAR